MLEINNFVAHNILQCVRKAIIYLQTNRSIQQAKSCIRTKFTVNQNYIWAPKTTYKIQLSKVQIKIMLPKSVYKEGTALSEFTSMINRNSKQINEDIYNTYEMSS